MRYTSKRYVAFVLQTGCIVALVGCSPFSTQPQPGPDKQFVGTMSGAASGAGAGAVIGAQLTASTGPGAVLGAGFGALFGMLSGLGVDMLEEDELRRQRELATLREKAWIQEVLAEHYQRRMELHPSRDIYPADWFFKGDSVELRPEAEALVHEIGKLSEERMPWSRLLVAAYVSSADPESSYSQHLSEKRAQAIALTLIRAGIEPRRVVTQGIPINQPILIDPDDHSERYRQAIEIIPLDR